MSLTEAHIETSENAPTSLTSGVVFADISKMKREKGRSMNGSDKTQNISHETLITKVARHNDKQAFRILFFHYAPRIKSYLLNFKVDDQRAEDLAQDVMMVLWQKADKFDAEKAKLSTWLFRIARNKFIDHTRRQKYPEVNADNHLSEMVAEERTDLNLEQSQISERVILAMKKLNDDQRKVIELSFFKELSHSQIADETSLPLGTVKSRIRTAFQLLRKELGEYE